MNSSNQSSDFVWKFIKVEQNPYDKRAATDPKALYEYQMSAEGSNWLVRSGITYEEVERLLAYFDVKTPNELQDKTFKSQKDDHSLAVNYLITVQKYGGKYTPPSDEELYRQTAVAMSKMKCPDFSDIDKDTVFTAFLKVWEGFSAEADWMQNLQNRISALSNGQVVLSKGNSKDFPTRVRGPAEYLMLTKGKQSIMVIMGPYSTPVSFY